MATLSYSLDNPIIVKINQLWKDQFNIDELQTTLVHLQDNRAKSNGTRNHVQNELDKIIRLSSSIDRKTQTIEAELPQLMKQVEKLESHVMAVDKKINTCSIQCNEYRLNDPAKIQCERLLRLAAEEEEESRKINEEWETKVRRGRNQRNNYPHPAQELSSSNFFEARTRFRQQVIIMYRKTETSELESLRFKGEL